MTHPETDDREVAHSHTKAHDSTLEHPDDHDEDAIVESVTSEHVDWAATWEVDEFAWPDESLELFDANKEYFLYAGEKLRDASHEGLKVLAVAATREKEGCTTLAICLARGAAAAGAKVALIDCNLFNPELGFKLGLDFSRGWQESYSEGVSLAEAAVVSLDDHITLFPLSADHRIPSLSDPTVSDVFRFLSKRFDLVIIDSGAIPSGDALVFESGEACPVQAGMVVRDIRRSTEVETLVTASRLKSLGIEAIGIAENFTHQSQARSAAA
jgi:Mrp family chromosome partitioning ATPase